MITIAQVRKSFDAVTALDGVSLGIEKGERVAFVGANGSGKTTLLRAMLGLVQVEGKITIAGSDVAREPEIAMRSVAYIPQIAPPIDAPVSEVVKACAALRGRPIEAIRERAERLGLSMGIVAGKRFRDLSGGMKQKLLAAMALAAETPILVCDEPTANLDGAARAAFFEQLEERPATGIVVLCSHRIEEVRQIVGRVVELAEGKIVRDASLTELLRDLRAFRVEVAVREGGDELVAKLLALGFSGAGARRYASHVSQGEKVGLVTRLLKEHEDSLADLSVVPVDDFSVAAGAVRPRPRLEVVA
jgi:ABC-type multidrug transport system ATPase subunit